MCGDFLKINDGRVKSLSCFGGKEKQTDMAVKSISKR